MFSPRAWGWSETGHDHAGQRGVLPTRVGMVLSAGQCMEISFGSPHARGDGPSSGFCFMDLSLFSPRAWGWSAQLAFRCSHGQVLPTRVGMVRAERPALATPRRSPHARGDGPHIWTSEPGDGLFSPRAWGWSVIHEWSAEAARVLPTRVGMVRAAGTMRNRGASSAHARGELAVWPAAVCSRAVDAGPGAAAPGACGVAARGPCGGAGDGRAGGLTRPGSSGSDPPPDFGRPANSARMNGCSA